MGRKARHSARTGDGGAEVRLRKKQLKEAQQAQKQAELTFYDDPSENESDSEQVQSEDDELAGQEVLELGGDEDDDDEEEEEEEADDDDDDDNTFDAEGERKKAMQMEGKWGKSRKTFYSADTAEYELESDEEVAKDEEEAALELQRKQAEMMDDEDFGIDEPEADGDEDDEEEQEDEAAPVDDEDLVGAQGLLQDDQEGQAADREPVGARAAGPHVRAGGDHEGAGGGGDTGRREAAARAPQIAPAADGSTLSDDSPEPTAELLGQHLLLLAAACGGQERVGPPGADALAAAQEAAEQTAGYRREREPKTDDGLDKFFAKSDRKRTADGEKVSSKKAKKQKKAAEVSEEELVEAERFYEQTAHDQAELKKAKKDFYTHENPALVSSDEDSDMEGEGGKRGASYQIMKNKGLKAHKSKLNRNPRVKKRMQYRKAVIRRKGQVRDVRVGEAGKYGGETTGIKSNLSRSRKIRN
ncbi:hypothetical protein ON010_g15733 [Phytophthora cinnamomi]|nr:hypothetical protein ON010_g15733 [Phytophthora cinnamomi]